MTPTTFPQANKQLLAPKGQEETCSTLPVYADGTYCISSWKPTFKEWLTFLFQRKVWVWVQSGHTQPPIAITTDNPFAK